jgi:hypothetical protein
MSINIKQFSILQDIRKLRSERRQADVGKARRVLTDNEQRLDSLRNMLTREQEKFETRKNQNYQEMFFGPLRLKKFESNIHALAELKKTLDLRNSDVARQVGTVTQSKELLDYSTQRYIKALKQFEKSAYLLRGLHRQETRRQERLTSDN